MRRLKIKKYKRRESGGRVRIFFDIDGVLAAFNRDATLEQLYEPGYFRRLEPVTSVLNAAIKLTKDQDVEIFTLSSAFNDDCIRDKNLWLDKFFKGLPKENRVFCYYGENKGEVIQIRSTDVLVDDLSDNLRDFTKAGGRAIKMYNGINGTKGTWDGFNVRSSMDPELLSRQIKAIATIA